MNTDPELEQERSGGLENGIQQARGVEKGMLGAWKG